MDLMRCTDCTQHLTLLATTSSHEFVIISLIPLTVQESCQRDALMSISLRSAHLTSSGTNGVIEISTFRKLWSLYLYQITFLSNRCTLQNNDESWCIVSDLQFTPRIKQVSFCLQLYCCQIHACHTEVWFNSLDLHNTKHSQLFSAE